MRIKCFLSTGDIDANRFIVSSLASLSVKSLSLATSIRPEKYSSVIVDRKRVLTSFTLLIARSTEALATAIVASILYTVSSVGKDFSNTAVSVQNTSDNSCNECLVQLSEQ
jgi:hypothetical protein